MVPRVTSFTAILAMLLLAAPLAVEAQPAKTLPRVAVLYPGSPVPGSPVQQDELAAAFVQGMRDNGYVDGKDFALDVRYVGTRLHELDRIITELLPLRPDVIVTVGSQGAWAAKRATSTIPIVMAVVADPVGQGLVTSLPRPGGNLTGNAILTEEVIVKRLELVREVLPRARRIGVLQNPSNPMYGILWNRLESAAKQLGLTLLRFDAVSATAVDTALDEVARQRPDALMVGQDSIFYLTRSKIVQSMSRQGVPAIYAFKEAVAKGGLMSYANSSEAMFRRAAMFVSRILKGARPSDLPVEQATTFELVINLKTAKALGLAIPPSLLLRADQVVE
jgi:putative ABC transport system substrate-binding protein